MRFKDFYGCGATIKGNDASGYTLTIRTPHGKIVHRGSYKTMRGAKIAMGKRSDCWKQIN